MDDVSSCIPAAYRNRAFLSIPEFASCLGVSRTAIETGWREGRFRTAKIGARRLIPVTELARLEADAMASVEGTR